MTSAPSFQFLNPIFFWLIPLGITVWFFIRNRSKPVSFSFASLDLFKNTPQTLRLRFQFLPRFLRALVFLSLVAALARPVWGFKTSEILSEGIDILLTIDTSASMKALDFKLNGEEANRLDVVKSVVHDFISKRISDRIGMVVFGEDAFTQVPLTNNHEILDSFLQAIPIGVAGDGTAIGNALATSVKRLKDQKAKSRIIILLTDGKSNAGSITPEMGAAMAKEFGVKVYTIGVGTNGPVPYPQETPFGIERIYARLDFDEDTLKQIADTTGGAYFRASGTEELEEIYSKIDQLEKSEVKVRQHQQFNELYAYFLGIALILLLLEWILRQSVFFSVP